MIAVGGIWSIRGDVKRIRLLVVIFAAIGAMHPVASVAAADLGTPPRATPVTPAEVNAWSAFGASPHPDGREFANITWAPEIGRVVLVGGITNHGIDDDVWVFDPGHPEEAWRQIHPAGQAPPTRMWSSGVWDAAGRRVVIFGGQTTLSGLVPRFADDVWGLEFDATGTAASWRRLHAGSEVEGVDPTRALAPTGRMQHSAVYDPTERRMLVYGGLDLARFAEGFGAIADNLQRFFTGRRLLKYALGDVWSFDLEELRWSPYVEEGIPRYGHQAVWDPANGQMVVTGGYGPPPEGNGSWYRGETESFDPGAGSWTRWSPAGDPPAIKDAAHAYSPDLGAMLVMGFDQPSSGLDPRRVYALRLGPEGEGAEWMALPNAPRPRRSLFGMAGTLIPGPDRFVVLGGFLGGPGSRRDHALTAYDVASGRWDRPLADLEPLPATQGAQAAADGRGGLYVLGGMHTFGRPWRLDLPSGRWERVEATAGWPAGAVEAPGITFPNITVAEADRDGRLLVIEGCMTRLWWLDPTAGAWTTLEPEGAVPSLCAPLLVYDPPRERFVALGGHIHSPDGGASLENRQVFSLEMPREAAPRWERLAVTGSAELPSGSGVYDPYRDRILTSTLTGGVQALDFAAGRDGDWTRLEPSGDGPPGTAPWAFDVANDRVVAYWGCGDGRVYALELSETPAWQPLETTEDPPAHCWAAADYDPVTRRLVTYGGLGPQGVRTSDTYVLELGGDREPPPQSHDPAPAGPGPPPPVVGGTWERLGPSQAHVQDVDFLFGDPQRALAATSATTYRPPRAGGVVVSDDDGASWSDAAGDETGVAMTEIAQSPADPSRIYAASIHRLRYGELHGSGMYVSEDGGRTWQRSQAGLHWDSHWAVAAHPHDPLVAWAAGEKGGLYRTDDGGRLWRELSRGGLSGLWVNALAAVPTPWGVRLLAGVRQNDAPVAGEGGVFLSDDGGRTWSVAFSTEQFVKALAVDPADPGRIVAAEGYGVWRSEDYGETWSHVNGNTWQEPTGDDMHFAALEFDPTSEGEVLWGGGVGYPCDFKDGFAGGAAAPPPTPGLWRSDDGGATWSRVGEVPQDDFCGVAVSDDGRTILAGGLFTGVWRSADAGATWSEANDGITQSTVLGVAPHPVDEGVVAAAAGEEGLLVTSDGGRTWDRRIEVEAHDVAAAHSMPGRFVAVAGGTAWVSDDGGREWRDTGKAAVGGWDNFPTALAVDPADPDTWYVQTSGSKLGVTRDNGATMQAVDVRDAQTGKRPSCLWSVAIDPVDPSTVYVGDGCGEGLFRSRDGGATWSQLAADVAGGHVMAVAADPAVPGRVWIGTHHLGVYRSDDRGETWTPTSRGIGYPEVWDIAVAPGQTPRILAATIDRGVWESNDGGEHWSPVAEGAPALAITDLAVGAGGRIAAGTFFGGALRLSTP